MSKLHPPIQCRVRVYGYTYDDDKEVDLCHLLTWEGEVKVRRSEDLDDEWTVYSQSGQKLVIQCSDLDILGRKDGIYNLSDAVKKGVKDIGLTKEKK